MTQRLWARTAWFGSFDLGAKCWWDDRARGLEAIGATRVLTIRYTKKVLDAILLETDILYAI